MKTAWLIADEHDMNPDDVREIIDQFTVDGLVCWVDRDADLVSDEAVELVESFLHHIC